MGWDGSRCESQIILRNPQSVVEASCPSRAGTGEDTDLVFWEEPRLGNETGKTAIMVDDLGATAA